jgi:hypothetical protein
LPLGGESVSGSLSRIRLYAGSLTCARTDGCCVSSGGRDVHTRCPLARPFGGSPPTLAGALPPECIIGSRRTFSLYGCFSALRLHVSRLRPGLSCIVLFSRLCYLRVVCINMNTLQRTRPPKSPRRFRAWRRAAARPGHFGHLAARGRRQFAC